MRITNGAAIVYPMFLEIPECERVSSSALVLIAIIVLTTLVSRGDYVLHLQPHSIDIFAPEQLQSIHHIFV